MKPFRVSRGPRESVLLAQIRNALRRNGWLVEKTHGNCYQSGFPDLLCFHPVHGLRWVEVKRPSGRLTTAQRVTFARWEGFKMGVWVFVSPTEVEKIFESSNWREWA